MKKSSSHLYDLVHSLSKTEKRYVKLRATSGESQYLQLMDAILDQDYFDESQLVQRNKGARFINHLSVSKRYLYDFILGALDQYNCDQLSFKIKRRIVSAEILIKKGLFKAASMELTKGKKMAIEFELFEYLLELIAVEKALITELDYKTHNEQAVKELFESELQCLNEIKNSSEYWFMAHQIARFQKAYQKIQTIEHQEYIETITRKPIFQNIELATNYKSKMFYYLANSTYQFMIGEVEKAYEFNRAFLVLLESNTRFLQLYSERYLSTLNNMLIDCLGIGKLDIFEEGLNRLTKLPSMPQFKSIKNIEAVVFRQRYLLLLNWSIRQKDYKKALVWIPKIKDGLEEYGSKIEKHHRVTLFYLNAYLLFINEKYNEAFDWLTLILNDGKEDVVKEIYTFSRVLNVLVHYELKNFELLNSLLLSVPKYLRSRRTLYESEKRLFNFLLKMIKPLELANRQEQIKKFKKDLERLSLKKEERRLFNYLDLRLWNLS